MHRALLAPTLLCVLATPVAAHAVSVTFGAVNTFTIAPSADTLSFSSGSFSVSNGAAVTQNGLFIEGHSGLLVADIPITFQDTVTVNSITKVLTFSGDDSVAIAVDQLTIDALGPITFGAAVLDFGSVTEGANSTANQFNVPLSATLSSTVTPEPSSLALLSTGVFAAMASVRRRYRRTEGYV